MAEQSQQNVVVQPQSTDVTTSVDVSANNSTALAAAAETVSDQLITSNTSVAEHAREDYSGSVSSSGHGRTNSEGIPIFDLPFPAEKQADIWDCGIAQSATIDGSVGSDTDTSRTEIGTPVAKDGDFQVPRSNTRKSASFKPVSVTKNFLAKAVSSSAPIKPGNERSNSSAGPSPVPTNNTIRPRLVAKTASGLRGSIPKSVGMSDKSGSSAGPDPNQVWNKNRVSTPQATPKHLTDEELRQQYGIQLASRPDESDERGAKWADIDDEEDDWAPETIEWNDGTKINLAQADTSSIAIVPKTIQQPENRTLNEERPSSINKPSDTVSKPTTVGPNATVLKVGAASHQKTSSISSKSLSDKPTLVAKSPAPAPIKSPWATLPAVDKVPPVPINPPVQQSMQLRFSQKDSHGFEGMASAAGPQTKEIAADDFSRFSRESTNGVPRELFVPQSGRYEPVSDSRRGPARKDSSFRPPSVLQRPSQNEPQGPAEPSAAFQTTRSQYDSVPWSRRRASSNVSGESGRFGRRMSFNKNIENPIVPSRRNSQLDSSTSAALHAQDVPRDASPAQSLSKSTTSQSPTVSLAKEAVPQENTQQESTEKAPSYSVDSEQEDPLVAQRRVMREKREAAVKRKKEEEEREQAERRERIRLKMEKLGLTDEKMGRKETAEAGPKAASKGSKDVVEASVKDADVLKERREPFESHQQSPPKPPVPSATGPPQQYGLIKVHATQSASHSATPVPKPNDQPAHKNPSDGKQSVATRSLPSLINGEAKEVKNESGSQHAETRVGDTNNESRSWANLPHSQSAYPNWGSSGGLAAHSAPAGNLWGPPNNHRALGNGDFHNNLQRTSLRTPQTSFPPQHLTTTQPQPIGTPRQASQTRGVTAAASSSDLRSRSIIEDSQTIPAFPPAETESLRLAGQVRSEQPSNRVSVDDLHSFPPSASMNLPAKPVSHDQAQVGRAAWANFSTNVADVERAEAKKAAQEHANRVAEQQLNDLTAAGHPVLSETWKQVKRGESHGTRQIVNHVKSSENFSPAPQSQALSEEIPKISNHPASGLPVRSRYSDFFGQDQHASSPANTNRSKSPSAPPPDSLDHPAYVGVSQKPLVNLPYSKPREGTPERPIVKLPPVNIAALKSLAHTNVDARVTLPLTRGPSQPIVAHPSWQDRFNGLFNRKIDIPERKITDSTDFSVSKEPLEINTLGSISTSVTLPPELKLNLEKALISAEDESALFEEKRDFGSTPHVRLPAGSPDDGFWQPAKEPSIPFKRAKALALREHDISSVPLLYPLYTEHSMGLPAQIIIMIPGMSGPKEKIIQRASTRHLSRGGKGHPSKHRQGPRVSREPQSPQDISKRSLQENSLRSTSQNGSNNTQKPKPKQHGSQTTWARRVSAVAQ